MVTYRAIVLNEIESDLWFRRLGVQILLVANLEDEVQNFLAFCAYSTTGSIESAFADQSFKFNECAVLRVNFVSNRS